MPNLPKDYVLPPGARVVTDMSEDEERQAVYDGLSEDMPSETDLEMLDLGLHPETGDKIQTSDVLPDGTTWKP